MSLVRRHTIVRERAPLVDDGRGNEEPNWDAWSDPKSIPGWGVDAGSTAEDLQHRDGDLVQYTIRGPFDADVLEGDRITLFGVWFRISGAVVRQPGPSMLTSHTIIQLQQWKG